MRPMEEGSMGGVPANIGVFFGKGDKQAEGWYWTDASMSQRTAKGPFETKAQAIENALQALSSRESADEERGS
jgi:hypothetical protein